jgi:hypothetical protein
MECGLNRVFDKGLICEYNIDMTKKEEKEVSDEVSF